MAFLVQVYNVFVRKEGEHGVRVARLNLPQNQALGFQTWKMGENLFNGHASSPGTDTLSRLHHLLKRAPHVGGGDLLAVAHGQVGVVQGTRRSGGQGSDFGEQGRAERLTLQTRGGGAGFDGMRGDRAQRDACLFDDSIGALMYSYGYTEHGKVEG